MKVKGAWTGPILWLLSFFLTIRKLHSVSPKTIRTASQEQHKNDSSLSYPLQSHRRQGFSRKHSEDHVVRNTNGVEVISTKGRVFEKGRSRIHYPGDDRATDFPAVRDSKEKKVRSKQFHREVKHDVYRQRYTAFKHFHQPKRNERWKKSNSEESDDALIKRSRNRVRLKSKKSHHHKMELEDNSFKTLKDRSKYFSRRIGAKEAKRQRIFGGIMPYQNDYSNRQVMQGEEMGFPSTPSRLFADSTTANSQVRALNPSHFYAPPVHKFLPAEHRFSSSPIHRYLSSPVIFKSANNPQTEGTLGPGPHNKVIVIQKGPFDDGEKQFFQGPSNHRQHIMIAKRPHFMFERRPLQGPVNFPLPGPPQYSPFHLPLPLTPQRLPAPFLFHPPRPQPFVIVHHREFYGPAIDPCAVNPCKNGGTCTAVVTEFRCICPVGYKGDRCQVQSKCNPNPCKNFGRCTELPDDFECTCHSGFHGKTCDLESRCEPSPCKNGGTCTENIENYICSCVTGFMGKNCEQESKCLPVNPCKNGGVCTEGLSGYRCNCRNGYFGINCEVRASSTACDSYPCHNGATCIADLYDSTKYSCYCATGYTGLGCEEKGFESLSFQSSPCGPINPCLFGGHCIPENEEYTCVCPEGREGSRCERLFQEKSCQDCNRHAICIYNKCSCRQGYVGDGKSCQPKRSRCHPNPCENGGTCHERETADTYQSDWWCECTKGYNGPDCHDFDPCTNFKCQNGGRCEVTNNVPRCICEPPFQGVSCLLDNACLPKDGVIRNPCLNGGKCDFTDYGEVRCTCPIPYEGPTCAENKCDKCDKKHAFCEQGICKCKPPYTGDGMTCEKPTKVTSKAPKPSSELPSNCNPNKCLNGAQCIEGKNTFFCVCPKHTYGRLCEKKITPTNASPKAACHPNPCLNGGICKDTGVNQDYDCICPNPRFKGRFCDVDMCAECDSHARCINGKCICRRGYKGDGFSCKKEATCPQYSVVATDNTCVCNPGYYMSTTGKRVCIPANEEAEVRALPSLKNKKKKSHGRLEDRPISRGGQQWSEDIIVTEYGNLGCWADTTEWKNPSKRAMMVLEGLEPLLADNYHERKQPISKCADVAKRLGFRVFGVQNGGQCFGGADEVTYKTYGPSEKCIDGVGGSLANDVYKL